MKELHLKNRVIKTSVDAFVMGIVNCNSSSFYKKSCGGLALAKKMIGEGADIIDLGCESTKPGSKYIDAEEELKNLVPLVKEIRKFSNIPLSIDTRKKIVMQECLKEGADILNDVSALEDDSSMADFIAREKIPVILMHKKGIPSTMQNQVFYNDVFYEVNSYLEERIKFALEHGIEKNKIIIDPGIGFGKNLSENKILISKCGKLCNGNFPVLMALSRKSCIGEMTGKSVDGRLAGTLAANLYAVTKGACILRVHDVSSCVDTLRVLKLLKEVGE